ncbi:glycosyltransferase family 4 protein [Kitasatospora cheerisanensis]|uniref:Glycosyl transferase family 1 n=1 Tax=Kitasatospora cheerisanensis KCTC 2395 TaxID=1348663 RepID=A0A066YPW5_9ACTN|nr:glycosyltransferase family 4 protein [Kitasatospora cheerisanensis]KDN82029.1 glycosyl transferase family 1 [Kitasatospora cheerisanensis KCTC 2395]
MPTTLIVTNDFPPRQGGIETFVHAMAVRMPGHEVVVYTSAEPGAEAFDRTLPFPVVRDRSRMLLPTGRVTRRAVELARAHGCERVWFGAAAPLAAMAPALRQGGVRRLVATTHGHEIWWARTPGARALLRRVGAHCDVVTYLGEYTRQRIGPALGPGAGLERLVPGVDPSLFRPSASARRTVRERYGLGDAPVVLCVARLVPRKGQDMLVRALPLIRRRVPGSTLLLVGQGPDETRLRRLAERHAPGAVVFAGGHRHGDTAPFYAAADVFAMPCRTRRAGLEAEGLGIVFLEASASGLPVVAGRSGGAPDAVLPHRTGTVVDGRDLPVLADAVASYLEDPPHAAEFGRAGRAWVERQWTWDASAARLNALLADTTTPPDRLPTEPRPR